MMDNFTKISAPNMPAVEPNEALILAYMRTRPSFMSGIFTHYPETF